MFRIQSSILIWYQQMVFFIISTLAGWENGRMLLYRVKLPP